MAGEPAEGVLVEGAKRQGVSPGQPPEADVLPKESSHLAPPLMRLRASGHDAVALVLLLAFALALCWPITTGKVPVASDTLALWPPWSQLPHEPIANSAIADSTLLYLSWNVFERNAIRDGEWPLWDPHTFSGAPFAANSQNQLYYPL